LSLTPVKQALHFTGQAQILVRLRRIGEKDSFRSGLR
jgi:hypothetical protein